MFRLARGFLLLLPAIFTVAVGVFFLSHPRSHPAFVPPSILLEKLGDGLPKGNGARFVATAVIFFVPAYLLSGLLLFLADVGIGGAAALLDRGKKRRASAPLPPEFRIGVVVFSMILSVITGLRIDRPILQLEQKHGVAVSGSGILSVLMAIVPFVISALALLLAIVISAPRAILGRNTR